MTIMTYITSVWNDDRTGEHAATPCTPANK